jgi:4-amino-4-deoxychorismate lyase
MEKCLINGEEAHSVPVTDRGLNYGDGLFETIAIRAGAARFLTYHLERLFAGCARLGIPAPERAVLDAEITALARNCAHGTVKLIVTRGPAARGYRPPATPTPTRIVGLMPSSPPPPETYQQGIRLRWCATIISRNPALAGLKTLGRLEQVMARIEWTDPDIHEGLMRDGAGHVICGTMSNLFMVNATTVSTPELSQCGVHGVMRRVVLEQAQKLGMTIHEIRIGEREVLAASELFVTNALLGLRAVSELDNRRYRVGPVARRLIAALADLGVRECGA